MDTECHRRRLSNLAAIDYAVRACARTHTVGQYLAGQVTYNLGDYPARFSCAPTEYDEQLLAELADHGVHLIQLHEEWSDSLRVLGADKFTAHDPEGLRRFVDLVHTLGMKIIVYASTGFFSAEDPDFRPEWARPDRHLVELYFDYARCSPASPSWRAYMLPKLERVLNEYGIDGLYDDLGYAPLHLQQPLQPSHISPGPETEERHSALEDLLGLALNIVRRHNGILKVHAGGCSSRGLSKAHYDYLWVGESVVNIEELCAQTNAFDPYVVPCLDMSRAAIEDEDDLFLFAIPYLQFPLRVDGRPVTGERGRVPSLNYRRGMGCFWTRHMSAVWEYYQANPDAAPMYGWWDSCPGRPAARSRWLHHFDLYRPMVTAGSRAWLDIHDSNLFNAPLPDDVVTSAFVNDRVYLVLGNFGQNPVSVSTVQPWRDRETGHTGQSFTLPARDLLFLSRLD